MRRSIVVLALALGAGLILPGVALAKGPPSPSFYVDGTLYRTVGTPTDLSNTGAPDSSFDTIYQFFGVQQFNVATAAPGDQGFNGGRWRVHGLEFGDYDAAAAAYGGSNDVFDSAGEVLAALNAGAAVDIGIVKSFECPVIPLGGH
ncbi:MAG: hypothetical protein WB297_01020 [Actinomycetota bacterium]